MKSLEQLLNSKKEFMFISPHLDDALLSCGALITKLAESKKVTVITLFSESQEGRQTLSAKKAVSLSGFSSASELYKARREEDKKAVTKTGASFIHLGFTEALWRKKTSTLFSFIPELVHTYPTYKFHIQKGTIAKEDFKIIEEIRKRLKEIVSSDALVFTPLGLGRHVDHIIARKVTEMITQPIYYADQPYLLRGEQITSDSQIDIDVELDYKAKADTLSLYKTQIPLLFTKGDIPYLAENYFSKQSILPVDVAGYTLQSETLTDKYPKAYVYGLYKNKQGKHAFAKMGTGTNKRNDYLLMNEIQAYKLLHTFLSKNSTIQKKYSDIRIPELLYHDTINKKPFLLLSHITGNHLLDIHEKDRIDVLQNVLSFLKEIKIDETNKIQLIKRTKAYWISILPLITVRAYIQSSYRMLILRAFFASMRLLPTLLFDTRKTFVHRDIGYWNCMVDNKNITVYDLQLASIAHPLLEYAATLLKVWDNKTIASTLRENVDGNRDDDSILSFYSLVLGIYDLSLSDGGNPSQTKDFLNYTLKRVTENKLGFNLYTLLTDFILPFIHSPKDFLFSFTESSREKVKLVPFSPELTAVADTLISEIKKTCPIHTVQFVGSAALKLPGQRDIDLLIPSDPSEFHKVAPNLIALFGKPIKKRRRFVEWHFESEGCAVQLLLIDPNHILYKSRMRIFNVLKENKQIRTEYTTLKSGLNGISHQTYVRKRMEFFNRISKL